MSKALFLFFFLGNQKGIEVVEISEKYELFKESAKSAAEKFSKVSVKEKIRIISHLDSDGITACSILINALNLKGYKYSLSVVHQLDEKTIREVSQEKCGCFLFTDIGSGKINDIKEILGSKKVFILDHHEPEAADLPENIVHVNPHLFGIDGTSEISGAGVVYFFAKSLDPKNEEMARVAVVGAIGDIQENNGFSRLNQEILEDAISNGSVKVINGLKLFGAQTKPLYKILQYSELLPDLRGSESRAISFMQQIGIEPKQGNEWKKIVHLTDEEKERLAAGIIMGRLGEENPEDIFCKVYIMCNEEKESPLRDAREFSTLLNACGRLGKASLGIGACLNDEEIKKKAVEHMNKYKREIVKTMKWYNEFKASEDVVKSEGLIIINAKENVRATMIGTLASMISSSNELEKDTYIISMARLLDGNTKVSLRSCGRKDEADLFGIISQIASLVGGTAGGHSMAAGAVIPTEKEYDFVEEAKRFFETLRSRATIP